MICYFSENLEPTVFKSCRWCLYVGAINLDVRNGPKLDQEHQTPNIQIEHRHSTFAWFKNLFDVVQNHFFKLFLSSLRSAKCNQLGNYDTMNAKTIAKCFFFTKNNCFLDYNWQPYLILILILNQVTAPDSITRFIQIEREGLGKLFIRCI